MKKLNPTKKDLIILTLSMIFIITIIIFSYSIERQTDIHNAKQIFMEEQIKQANIKAITQSDIEQLEFYAKENARSAKLRLKDISEYKEEITKLQSLYENEVLSQRCFESQIDRKINGLEYNLTYCNNETSLDQFRIKKH